MNNDNKSDFFNLDENIAAMLTALIPLGVTFIGYASYAAWLIPLVVLLLEKRSQFVRFCAAQSLAVSLLIFICSMMTKNIDKLVNQSHNPFLLGFGLVGMVLSLVQLACLVVLILLTINAYKKQTLEIPVLNDWLRKNLGV